MKLHEYQSKAVLAKAGLPVPKGKMVETADQVPAALKELGISTGLVKAQAHTGGRGKAGGVKFFKSAEEAATLSEAIIGMTLVTKQTGEEGILVEAALLEDASNISRELYVAITIDRAIGGPVIMISQEGGMEIEEVAEETPDAILKQHPAIDVGITDEMAAEGAKFLALEGDLAVQYADVIRKLLKVFVDGDCNLLEINPLIVSEEGDLALLDCKYDIDDNAAFRQMETGGDPKSGLNAAEIEATEWGMSYIQLDGNIGCMVNGAGLAMATMDIIKEYGQEPANFLDVGGSATEEAVAKAFELITSDKNVKAILVNIFGGIMKCDVIARGIIEATKKVGLELPLVVRLEGTNVEAGQKLINESGLNIISATTMADGAAKVAAQIK
ncbi:ADP-forming succinate--CoA ligase subunit beta [Fibrobacterales bacterium]|nr:ADP-forming succinate--CoA ligase subunit beta [Fibrobacterales bacterium]